VGRLTVGKGPTGRVASARRRVSDEYRRHSYGILLLSLLLTLIAAPIASEYRLRTWLIELLLIVNLAIAAVGYDRARGRHRLLAVVALAAILRILGRSLHNQATAAAATLVSVPLAVFAAIAALRFALRGRHINSERLSAALSAYLLAGHCFGFVYFEVEQLRPGSFAIGGAATQATQFGLSDRDLFQLCHLGDFGIRRHLALNTDCARCGHQ